jgi:uncharacterized coiled-coil protein SlyX
MWEVYRERAVERRKRSESELNAIDSILREINDELNEEEQRRARLKELQQNLDRLVELRQAKNAAYENLRRLKDSLDEQRRMVDMLSGQLSALNQRMENRQPACSSARRNAKRSSSAWNRQTKLKPLTGPGRLPAPTWSAGKGRLQFPAVRITARSAADGNRERALPPGNSP